VDISHNPLSLLSSQKGLSSANANINNNNARPLAPPTSDYSAAIPLGIGKKPAPPKGAPPPHVLLKRKLEKINNNNNNYNSNNHMDGEEIGL
jgi:hypothetical protein